MKKLTNLLMALILLLSCVLTACTDDSDNAAEDTSSAPEIKNSILEYFKEDSDTLTVRDGLLVYTLNKDPNKSVITVPYKQRSTTQTTEQYKENKGTANVFLYTNRVDNSRSTGFVNAVYEDIEPNGARRVTSFSTETKNGEMPFVMIDDTDSWVYKWKGETENGYTPYAKITCTKDTTAPYLDNYNQGDIECSFTYEIAEDYKCILHFPNGETVERVMQKSGTGYQFESDRNISVDSIVDHYTDSKIYYALKIETATSGTYRKTFRLHSYENGVAITDIPINDGKINYTEPEFTEIYEDYKVGTMYLDGAKYEVTYHGEQPQDAACVHLLSVERQEDRSVSIIVYYWDNPEDSSIDVVVPFTWELDGDFITITYPNGYVSKQIVYRTPDGYALMRVPSDE